MEPVTAEGVAALVGSPRAVIVFSKAFGATWEVFPVAEQLVAGPALVLPHAAVESGESVAEALLAAHAGERVAQLDCESPRSAAAPVAVVSVALHEGAQQAVERALACAKAATGGRYVAVLVAEIAEPQVAAESPRQLQQRQAPAPPAVNGTTTSRAATYFPTYVWGWLLIMFALVFFALVALSSLSNVQVPPKLLSTDQAQHKKNK